MKVDLPTEQQVIKEALKILSAHMAPVKFARFVVACQLGEGDYLLSKDEIFVDETVDSLYEKVRAFEQGKT
ncbi:hypothetical protein B9T07_16640 [Limnospira fusiformis CCALA 023]